MRKVYRYNQYKNHIEVGICAPGGMSGKLVFDGGNVATKVMPTTIITSPFWQQVIDESKLVKDGYVTCIQTINDEDDTTPEPAKQDYTELPEITSLQQAVDYIADNFSEKARTINEALNIAHQNGVDFPNLKKRG